MKNKEPVLRFIKSQEFAQRAHNLKFPIYSATKSYGNDIDIDGYIVDVYPHTPKGFFRLTGIRTSAVTNENISNSTLKKI